MLEPTSDHTLEPTSEWLGATAVQNGRCHSHAYVGARVTVAVVVFEIEKLVAGGLRSLVLWSYKHNAGVRGYSWDLADDEVYQLFESPCHYCGAVGSNCKTKKKRTPYYYNGIDRVDNQVGYTLTNVVPCCGLCNEFKRGMSYAKFIAYLNQVAVFRSSERSPLT